MPRNNYVRVEENLWNYKGKDEAGAEAEAEAEANRVFSEHVILCGVSLVDNIYYFIFYYLSHLRTLVPCRERLQQHNQGACVASHDATNEREWLISAMCLDMFPIIRLRSFDGPKSNQVMSFVYML